MQLASRTQDNAPSARAELVGRFVRLHISAGQWRLSFAISADCATGALRDIAETASQITGADQRVLLGVVVNAVSEKKPRLMVLA